MMSTNLLDLTIEEASRRIRDLELSPVELTEATLEQISALNNTLNAFITVTGEQALEAAQQAEIEIRNGGWRGPFHGIPLGLKDLFETAGTRTTAGSPFFKDYIPVSDAEVVRRLAAAGAVFVGKLNMHEIALGITNVNPHYGPCRNPWDLDRMSGGSSGGSAVAVATRMCFGALGSDTGGSIRIPAALCGITGLKPTFGRVSLRGVMPLSWNLDHPGPMARTVEDVALMLQAIAGYDPEDPVSVSVPVDDYVAALPGGVRGWRIALATDPFFRRVEDPVWGAVSDAAEAFRNLGAVVEQVSIPEGQAMARANSLMVISDAAAVHAERFKTAPEKFGPDIRTRLGTGSTNSVIDYIEARRTQSLARCEFRRFFNDFDLLLTPATPVPAPPIEGPDAVAQAPILTSFTAPFNLTGLPVISVPCGFTPQGLPVGLQIVAPEWAEARLLRAACAYQTATGWHKARPPILDRGGAQQPAQNL